MAMVNRTPKPEMRECPLCHEVKPITRFFTQDADSNCRRCQIGAFHDEMLSDIQKMAEKFSWRSTLSHGYVYLFYSSLMGLHKIGKSINPDKRKMGLSVPDVELIFTFYTQHMSVHETLLHHIYQPQRVGGEWFRLDDSHVNEIKYIGSRLGTVIDSPEGFDWKKQIMKQREIEGAHRIEVQKTKDAEDRARIEAYRAYRAQFRRRCPNCLHLFHFKVDQEHKFCKRECRDQFKNSKRIQNAYLTDPDNIALALVDAWELTQKYDFNETEDGSAIYRDALIRLHQLQYVETELTELTNQAYDLMSRDN